MVEVNGIELTEAECTKFVKSLKVDENQHWIYPTIKFSVERSGRKKQIPPRRVAFALVGRSIYYAAPTCNVVNCINPDHCVETHVGRHSDLDEKAVAILVLEGKSVREIAEILNVPIGRVQRAQIRVKKKALEMYVWSK